MVNNKVRSLKDEVRVVTDREALAGAMTYSIAGCFCSGYNEGVMIDFG